MLKALFLDLDETLCDTSGANVRALEVMRARVQSLFQGAVDEQRFTAMYLKGIYRELDERYAQRLLPVENEGRFRLELIELILADLGVEQLDANLVQQIQHSFDQARSEFFDFFPSIEQMLLDFRRHFTLVVITNGPEFSQQAKVEAVKLYDYVDHIIIGGQEPEEKPAASIFIKALALAQCEAHEALHIGDSLKADIAGACNSGIRSIWVSHDKPHDPAIAAKPSHTVSSPLQLRGLIEQLAGL